MQNGYGYNPWQMGYMGGGMPQRMQQQMQQPSATMPQAQASNPWAIVQTVAQVEQVAVQPGGEAWIMVQNEPVFAHRTADRMGLISTEYCRFERYDPHAAAVNQKEVEYITRDELRQELDALKKELGKE